MFELKEYQKDCVAALTRYLKRCNDVGPKLAFVEQAEHPYNAVPGLAGLPYVCLRVPTGGGKTVLAAHTVGVATRELLHAERSLVLWLAPTDKIVSQTLAALRNRQHPYRKALDEAFPAVSIMELSDALYLTPATLQGETVIVVTTMASMRVNATEGRKVYETNGHLMAHFGDLTEAQKARLEKLNGTDTPAYSLANVFRLHRPIVIMDEAHNARTVLMWESLARFGPSCIIEFTATPDQERQTRSNVLYSVSAAELKADHMVKLPIRLTTRPQWKETIGEAINKRDELHRIAEREQQATGEYIRPIVLVQAQPRSSTEQTVNVDVLRDFLVNECSLPADEVKICTGERDELVGVDVLSPTCPVKYIITVNKLREGWDCSFAYILASVSNMGSATAIEQILGRVLRLPKATKKQNEALNFAYAFAASTRFAETLRGLEEGLVEGCGFAKFEARALVMPAEQGSLPYPGPLFGGPIEEAVTTKPALDPLPIELRERVTFNPTTQRLAYHGPPLSETDAAALRQCFTRPEDRQAVQRLTLRSRGQTAFPAALGEKLAVPVLAVRRNGQLEMFEDQYLDFQWDLSQADPLLTEAEFSATPQGHSAEVDVDAEGRVATREIRDVQAQLALFDRQAPRTEAELAIWLDHQIYHPDVPQSQSGMFLLNLVQTLMQRRGLSFDQLVTGRFRLRDAAERKMNHHRAEAVTRSFQQMLLPTAVPPVEVDAAKVFEFPLNQYPANRVYDGSFNFQRHYYEKPAAMNGEEAECAILIDSLPKVKYWVRNLERDQFAFWLPKPDGKFFPDFVALLTDGRILVVEYKGEHLATGEDTQEKQKIGDLWEARSQGRCLFRLVTHDRMESVLRAAAN